jgi:predicted ferric reductase
MLRGLSYIVVYIAIIVTPLALVALLSPHSNHTSIYEIGKSFALIGFVMLTLQGILAGRLKWTERPFGFDIVIRYHKYMAIFATLLLFLHPLLLAIGGAGWQLLTATDVPLYIWAGKATLVIVFLNVFLSLFQIPLRLKFEWWRIIHDVLAPSILVMAFFHSFFVGSDIQIASVRLFWVSILGLTLIIFVYQRFLRPWRLKRHPYRVIDVGQETKNVWTVKLTPPEGEMRYAYLPGQFHFLTFCRGRNLPTEEHHWTISSSPTEKDYVSSTIKELGDFTSTIGQTKPGDIAAVDAPFGRFSYVLHPEERDLVFIVGGIGITPVMSMLRHMRDTRATLPVLLMYANGNENEIVFRKELSEIEAGEYPQLRVIHVLSKPGESWAGENGYINREKIERFCEGNVKDRAFYICGPPGLLEATIKNLRALGVADDRIHTEIFSFL